MIAEALDLLRNELQAYLEDVDDPSVQVVISNIALWEDGQFNTNMLGKVVISLVNVEEESTLKNKKHFRRNGSGGIDYVEPPVHLNLYLLFCSNYPTPVQLGDNYFGALKRLSKIIRFFQRKKCFSVGNSPNSSLAMGLNDLDDIQLAKALGLNLCLELYTMTFEQINHLWGSLGGKQIPFVMYKARLVEIQELEKIGSPVIEEIHNNLSPQLDP